MGLFEIIILLAFLLLPAISRFLESKRQQQQPPPEHDEEWAHQGPLPPQRRRHLGPPTADDHVYVEEEDPLADALRQIREALGQEQPRQPVPAPAPAPEPVIAPGYGARFEEAVADAKDTRTRLADARPALQVEAVHSATRPLSRYAKLLQNRSTARTAFIFHEIMNPPPALRNAPRVRKR